MNVVDMRDVISMIGNGMKGMSFWRNRRDVSDRSKEMY